MTECIFFYLRINTQHIRLTLYLAHEIALWQYKNLYVTAPALLCFTLHFQYKPPRAHIQRDDLTEGFLRYEF